MVVILDISQEVGTHLRKIKAEQAIYTVHRLYSCIQAMFH